MGRLVVQMGRQDESHLWVGVPDLGRDLSISVRLHIEK
jgi:hypothetical protein